MRNSNNSTNGYDVSGSGTTSAGAPTVAFTVGTPSHLTFSRTGTNVTFGAGPVGGTATTATVAASMLTNGTTVYGTGPVYPAVSFNNVMATITNLVIKDASGATVYSSVNGDIMNYVPASLTLSSANVSLAKGASRSVTATAIAIGGAVSPVTAVSADPTIATATVADGATNSTITINGLKGGVTMVTVTNTGDTNTATNSKTILVAVNDYATTDPYGSIATRAYPAPGATAAYTDGELALTFDAPPTLNTGGSIKIFALADGSAGRQHRLRQRDPGAERDDDQRRVAAGAGQRQHRVLHAAHREARLRHGVLRGHPHDLDHRHLDRDAVQRLLQPEHGRHLEVHDPDRPRPWSRPALRSTARRPAPPTSAPCRVRSAAWPGCPPPPRPPSTWRPAPTTSWSATWDPRRPRPSPSRGRRGTTRATTASCSMPTATR